MTDGGHEWVRLIDRDEESGDWRVLAFCERCGTVCDSTGRHKQEHLHRDGQWRKEEPRCEPVAPNENTREGRLDLTSDIYATIQYLASLPSQLNASIREAERLKKLMTRRDDPGRLVSVGDLEQRVRELERRESETDAARRASGATLMRVDVVAKEQDGRIKVLEQRVRELEGEVIANNIALRTSGGVHDRIKELEQRMDEANAVMKGADNE